MKDFGKRIKEERERLGLSQAQFARDCGVGKTAQYMYERGDREPSLSYINEARNAGADVLYILTGERSGSDWAYARAESKLLHHIEILLGLKENQIPHLCHKYVELDEQREIARLTNQNTVTFSSWIKSVKDWLSTSTNPDSYVDPGLLARILAEMETCLEISGATLPAEKKIKVLLMLYRICKASGKVDETMIKETIAIAGS